MEPNESTIQELKHALSLIQEDRKSGYCLNSKFLKLQLYIRDNIKILSQYKDTTIQTSRLDDWFRCVAHNLSALSIIVNRIDWQSEMYRKRIINQNTWMNYTSIDAEYIHVVMRSIFDYLASIIKALSNKPGQVSDKSFRKLLDKIEDPKNGNKFVKTKLGEELRCLFENMGWLK
jgi:hypothetical protein